MVPPPVLDEARVVEYALVDERVRFTGKLQLFANGKRITKVGGIAIGEHLESGELFLIYCDDAWDVLGVEAWNAPHAVPPSSVEEVKRRAETYYQGLSSRWVRHSASPEEAKAYYEARNKKRTCSFCGRPPTETKLLISSKTAVICNVCIDEYHAAIHKSELT